MIESAMIDWTRVETLKAEIGPADFAEVVDIFLEEVDEAIGALSGSKTIESDLHFLKGSAMNLGFQQFSKLCQIGELSASNDEAEKVDIAEILDCYSQSRSEFLDGLKAGKAKVAPAP